MATTRGPGTDLLPGAPAPATFGGPGFLARPGSHASEVAEGRLWRRCGGRSEWGPLRAVLLAEPGPELVFEGPADRWLMLDRIDLPRIRAQANAVAEAFGREGVEVVTFRPDAPPPPNFLFQRDLSWTTPEGAFLARVGSEQRAGEERHAQAALAAAGVPILGVPRGEATFEGADALWLRPDRVAVGVGRRTNSEGFRQVRAVARSLGARAEAVAIPADVQHLLGLVVPIDRGLAAVRTSRAGADLLRLLRRAGYEVLSVPDSVEVVERRAMNFVPLSPRRVLMPADCPRTRALLERAGVSCVEVDVSEYVKAGGALGCLVGVLSRDDLPSP